MAKPRLYLCNRPNPEGPGDGDDKEGEAATGQGRGGGGVGGKAKYRKIHNPPHPQKPQPEQGGPYGQYGWSGRVGGTRSRGGKRGRGGGRREPKGGLSRGLMRGGGCHHPRGKRGPPGIPHRTCVPVVAGSLWRLPAPQRWVAPGRGNSRQRCMEVSLAPARCAISELARHALWSGGAPIHENTGRGMGGGSRQELEL